jgi:hypothetical protein
VRFGRPIKKPPKISIHWLSNGSAENYKFKNS